MEETVVYRETPYLEGTENAHPLEVQILIGSDRRRRGVSTLIAVKNAVYVKLCQWLASNASTKVFDQLHGGIEVAVSFKDSVGSCPLPGGKTHNWS